MAGGDKLLAGVAGLLLVLVVGALFGRLHAADKPEIRAIGDRVACGLFALPLISVSVHLAFPAANQAWVLGAPLPLAAYVVLLAGTELGWSFAKRYFTVSLLVGVGLVYLTMAVGIWLF